MVHNSLFQIIYISSGCASDGIGMIGGKVTVELGPGCYNWPTLVFHELLHVLGMEHMHERADRDKYIDINFDNVDPDMKSQFEILNSVGGSNNVTWDYNSVMLYGSTDFQKKELKDKKCKSKKCYTITKKGGGFIETVYKKVPTKQDMQNINALYKCPEQKAPKQSKKPVSSKAAVGEGGVGGKPKKLKKS